MVGRGAGAERGGPGGRLLRHRPRPDAQLRVAAPPDEPRGREGLQLLVPHALPARPLRGGEQLRRGRAALLLRRLRGDSRRRPPGALPRAVAPPGPHRRHPRRRPRQRRLPVRGHQPRRRRQLRDARGARRGPLRGVQPQHPEPAPGRAQQLQLVRRGRRHDLRRRRGLPASLHGTGTEDYFNTAWCPTQVHHAPYHGLTIARRAELVREGVDVPLPHRGPGPVPAIASASPSSTATPTAAPTTGRAPPTGTSPSRTRPSRPCRRWPSASPATTSPCRSGAGFRYRRREPD